MSPSWRRVPAALVVGLGLMASACGLQADEEPQAITADEDLSSGLDTTPTTVHDGEATTPATVYLFVRDGDTTMLTKVQRPVEDPARAADRIEAVLQPLTAEELAQGLVSSIPADTKLLDAELDEASQSLMVNLTGALFDVQGEELANAFAQIVLTATELANVRQVSFEVDGEPFRAPNADGIEQPGAVTADDYSSLVGPSSS
jgi:spore germination protein GerM